MRYLLTAVLWATISSLSLLAAAPARADALTDAAKADDAAAVRRLLAAGADPNAADADGRTALYWALFSSSPKAAEVLIRAKATDPEKLTAKGENALMMAAFRGYRPLVELLLERGAEVNKPGWTPLHYAATNGHLEIVALLLEHSAYIDAESPRKATPLMMAARHGHAQVVRLLLDEGADATLKDAGGATAIDYAMLVGRRDIAEMIAVHLRKLRGRDWD